MSYGAISGDGVGGLARAATERGPQGEKMGGPPGRTAELTPQAPPPPWKVASWGGAICPHGPVPWN